MQEITIYGIKNCDTMKKAFAWLAERDIAYHFHDYKKLGVPQEKLAAWCRRDGWQNLINSKGPTWRKLDPAQQAISNASQALAVMAQFPSVIRRPILELADGSILLGFDPLRYEAALV